METNPNGKLIILSHRPLHEIAREINADWGGKGKGVNFAAKPYLDAMAELQSIDDTYWCDSGKSIVRYFLSNAGSWRGDTARRIKAELKGLV